ncbi:integral membrane protein [Microcella alkaliphila]|uniref:Integral membrane protein n=1 Tax=Microcella alkaliphila TaxID=279828 RepID=A0A0U5BMY5_9MICO|nr:integral membrane protein [Microcella alkaliphila]
MQQLEREGVAEPVPPAVVVDERAPRQRTSHRLPPERSAAATWAFVTGLAPFATSVIGNLVASQAGAQLAAGAGSLAMVLGMLTLVFVVNAALLTVCGITGSRGIRETANGYTRGRGLAVAGITLGSINLVLWLAGLVVSTTAIAPFFA